MAVVVLVNLLGLAYSWGSANARLNRHEADIAEVRERANEEMGRIATILTDIQQRVARIEGKLSGGGPE